MEKTRIAAAALALPDEVAEWIGAAPIYESSGASGAKTVYIARGEGFYLKIAEQGTLCKAAAMQKYFADVGMSAPVVMYISRDRDYLVTAPVAGEDGVMEQHLCQPERLSALFGQALRALHAVNPAGCPIKARMTELVSSARSARFSQSHLDAISNYIGPAQAEHAAEEIARSCGLLQNDVLMHGDYCLPNIMIDDWRFAGFIDLGESGTGDRHYDLAWGLWTLNYNLQSQKYGDIFLDAYGRDLISRPQLRICGLLSAMD